MTEPLDPPEPPRRRRVGDRLGLAGRLRERRHIPNPLRSEAEAFELLIWFVAVVAVIVVIVVVLEALT